MIDAERLKREMATPGHPMFNEFTFADVFAEKSSYYKVVKALGRALCRLSMTNEAKYNELIKEMAEGVL